MLPVKAPRDPAPSRVKYRLERLWLRPIIRKFVKTGVPLLLLAGFGAALAQDPQVQARTAALYRAAEAKVKLHPGLMVSRVEIRDASDHVAQAVADVMDVAVPQSSLDLDIAAIHRRIVSLDIVEAASVRLDADGVLDVRVTERIPALVWRSPDGLVLIDDAGIRVDRLAARMHRGDLPLVAGEGAHRQAAEALQLVAMAQPFRARIRGLVRVGERRWDLALDRDQVIQLPEDDPVSALARIIALDEAEDLLARDISVFDLRDARRPTLRLNAQAWDSLQALRAGPSAEDI